MATKIVIPREGQGMDFATIISWAVKVGDTVSFGDTLCEVESEKASFPIESSISGSVLAINFEAGAEVPVLKTIAIIGRYDEEVLELTERMIAPSNLDQSVLGDVGSLQRTQEKEDLLVQPGSAISLGSLQNKEKRRITPRARKLAEKLDLDINNISIDPIHERDVESYHERLKRITPAARAFSKENQIPIPQTGSGIGERIIVDDLLKLNNISGNTNLSAMRRTIAAKMLRSAQTTAQFTLNIFSDATNLLLFKKEIKESGIFIDRVSVNDLMIFLVSRTLREFSELNAYFENDRYTICENINIGFAVDLPEGLAVPVLKGTDSMSLAEISKGTKVLAEKCRLGKVIPADLQGGTFTVSNLGHLGIEYFTPLLNTPEVAILGLGGISPRVKRIDGGMVNVDCIHLSLTLNHQVIDGVLGSRFLRKLSDNIENIFMMFVK